MLAVLSNVTVIHMFWLGYINVSIVTVTLPCLWCWRYHFSISIKNQKKGGSPTAKEQEKFNGKEFSYQQRNKNISDIYPKDKYYEMPPLFQ